jgi:hypothetical protein
MVSIGNRTSYANSWIKSMENSKASSLPLSCDTEKWEGLLATNSSKQLRESTETKREN